MRIHGKTFSLILLLLAFTVSVHATPLHNDMGLSAPDVLIEFNELGLPTNTPITDQYAVFGVTFSPNLYQATESVSFPNITSGHLRNYISLSIDLFTIDFDADIDAVAFAMVTGLYEATSLKAYHGNVMVEEFFAPTDTSEDRRNNYYGFSEVVIDRLVIDIAIDSENTGMFLDSLQYNIANPVPEPATLTLFAVSLLGLALISKRKFQ